MTDNDLIIVAIADMRKEMVKAHPGKLSASVTDVLECALNVKDFQTELLARLAKVREAVKSIRIAQGISQDERWTERASAYGQAAEWIEEALK